MTSTTSTLTPTTARTGRPVLTTVLATGALMLAMGIAGTVSYLVGLDGYAPLAVALVPVALVLATLLTRHRAWTATGFTRPDLTRPGARLAVGLAALLPVTVLATAAAVTTDPVRILGYGALASLVGLVEETLFRGILPARFGADHPVAALVVPTLAFTLAHAVTAASPDQDGATTLRTVVFALAFGVLAALVTARTGSIWPAVALHAAVDTVGFLTTPRSAVTTDLLLIVLAAGAAGVLLVAGRRRPATLAPIA